MKAQAAILDSDGADVMNLSATEPGNQRDRSASTKFLYASGSRPLDGYTIKRGIGRGGFGEVYYATSDGGKEVALKLVRRNLDVELRGVAHCINLKHPNLLSVFDIRRDADDDTWVVMEYVGGDTLDAVVARYPHGMPEQEALAWIHGIGAGVAYLHDHGIVHRDLKPGNIFCDEGIVKLGDYGLSKFISASRRSGQTESVGTVHYMAPEVANGRYGKEIDIYALGVILYELLTGHVPFEGESVGEVLMKHLTARPELGNVAEPYRALLERILDKDPSRRPQSVAEVLSAIPGSTTRPVFSAAAPTTPEANAAVKPPPLPRAQPMTFLAAAPAGAGLGDEPIWKALRENFRELRNAWDAAELNFVLRVVILVLVVVFIISTSGIWAAAAVLYGIYYGIRALVFAPPVAIGCGLGSPAPPVPAAAMPLSPAVAGPAIGAALAADSAPPRPDQFWPSGERPALVLPLATRRETLTELIGSMLLSAVVTVCACFLVHSAFMRLEPNQFAWLTLVGTTGAWAVLIPSRLWQNRPTEEMPRRSILLLAGLALGFYAWTLDRAMLVSLPYSMNPSVRASRLHMPNPMTTGLFEGDGSPTLTGFLTYFGFLFVVPRWWKLNDPRRRRRFSLWTTALYGLWAWVLSLFWPFPDQFAITAATTIAAAVQLSSPWIHSRDRLDLPRA